MKNNFNDDLDRWTRGRRWIYSENTDRCEDVPGALRLLGWAKDTLTLTVATTIVVPTTEKLQIKQLEGEGFSQLEAMGIIYNPEFANKSSTEKVNAIIKVIAQRRSAQANKKNTADLSDTNLEKRLVDVNEDTRVTRKKVEKTVCSLVHDGPRGNVTWSVVH
jgi:hypothetical protein